MIVYIIDLKEFKIKIVVLLTQVLLHIQMLTGESCQGQVVFTTKTLIDVIT